MASAAAWWFMFDSSSAPVKSEIAPSSLPSFSRAVARREKRASEAEADRARVRQETEAAGGGAAARLEVRQAAEA